LQDYVTRTRDHIRREERVVLYAARSVSCAQPIDGTDGARRAGDPLACAAQLARTYPNLARALPSRAGALRRNPCRPRDGAAAEALAVPRSAVESMVEIYGELMHEASIFARANFEQHRRGALRRSRWRARCAR